jgi:hypothetical protein
VGTSPLSNVDAGQMAKADYRAPDLIPISEELNTVSTVSLRQIAAGLNDRQIKTVRGSQ